MLNLQGDVSKAIVNATSQSGLYIVWKREETHTKIPKKQVYSSLVGFCGLGHFVQ